MHDGSIRKMINDTIHVTHDTSSIDQSWGLVY
jgi:hypothetical protein